MSHATVRDISDKIYFKNTYFSILTNETVYLLNAHGQCYFTNWFTEINKN